MRPFLRWGRRTLVIIVRGTIRFIAKAISCLIGQRRALALRNTILEEVDPTIKIAGIRFDGSAKIPLIRAKTILTKEPDTIAWINNFVAEGDVFYDVGANVGVFSLYAAKHKNAKVIAFEPSADNYAWLNRNIFLNDLSENITAFNIALHDANKASVLNLSAFMPGKAGHGFDVTNAGSDYAAYTPQFKQGVLGLRMDEFIKTYDMPFPNHVKIDVDGNDPLVLNGMDDILADARLRSIAIESNPELREQDLAVQEKLKDLGFHMLSGEQYKNEAYKNAGLASNAFYVRTLS